MNRSSLWCALGLLVLLGTVSCKEEEKKPLPNQQKIRREANEKAERQRQEAEAGRRAEEEARVKAEAARLRLAEATNAAARAALQKRVVQAQEDCKRKKEQSLVLYRALEDCAAGVEGQIAELHQMEQTANTYLEDAKKKLGAMGKVFLGHVTIPSVNSVVSEDDVPVLPDRDDLTGFSCEFKVGQPPPEVPSINIEELVKACETEQFKMRLLLAAGKAKLLELKTKLNDLVRDHHKVWKNAQRVLAAIARKRIDMVSNCMAVIKRIDRKWTGGKGWNKFCKQVQSQEVQALIASGYMECYNGYIAAGKDHYDEARRQGLHSQAVSFLKRNCKAHYDMKLERCR